MLDRYAEKAVAKRARIERVRDVMHAANLDEPNSSDESMNDTDQSHLLDQRSDNRDREQDSSESDDEARNSVHSYSDNHNASDDSMQAAADENRSGDDEHNVDESEIDDENELLSNGNHQAVAIQDSDSDAISDGSESDEEDQRDVALQFGDEHEREEYVCFALREWALCGGVLSVRKLDQLLENLHPLYPKFTTIVQDFAGHTRCCWHYQS